VRLATRFFISSSLLVAATVLGLILAADRILRKELESETGAALEREARLVERLIPPDSTAWPEIAISLGQLVGHRVTLIDPSGRVRGDTEFPADALPGLEITPPAPRCCRRSPRASDARCATASPPI
jgi:hypothetical protein